MIAALVMAIFANVTGRCPYAVGIGISAAVCHSRRCGYLRKMIYCELLFEVMRLRALGRKFYERAMDGDGDKDAGVLYIKASERLATLLGMNAVQGHVPTVIHQDVKQQTCTEKLRGLLDNIMHIGAAGVADRRCGRSQDHDRAKFNASIFDLEGLDKFGAMPSQSDEPRMKRSIALAKPSAL